jgi:ferredoxin
MDAYLQGLSGILWGVCTAVLAWNVIDGWHKALARGASVPWFGKLARRGLTPAQAEQAIGTAQLARAVRRCVLCGGRPACSAGCSVDCPNASTLERLTFARSIE